MSDLDKILEDDPLGLLGEPDAEADTILNLRHVTKPVDQPDFVAKRKACKEFDRFEPLFRQQQSGLKNGTKILRPFVGERQIAPGEFFLLQGMLVYVANIGNWERKNFGNKNARSYCVFENGTESNLLVRSLAAALWKTEGSMQVVDALQEEINLEGDQPGRENIGEEDRQTGWIYLLKSLSRDPQISGIENLYKIGYSTQPVEERIKNAVQEPTYLMADVQIVTTFQTYNLNPQKLEHLLHTFFAEARLEIEQFDGERERNPEEWFIVPLHWIETAVQMLVSGDVLGYRYDAVKQEIVEW